ncbi:MULTISPECIES: hypothetical protein [Legionella]|uniref:Uncharacterized protein n=1 Tax=Legionella maceachernii TaxID=466 RepID=A0A0W0W472_9GAMM|nr:hypothetical protein [Legionella maceachernii]KTD27164.1 hypothetical protein Lmac_1412 [Legionella maceachernii]SKA13744.1 hypothetical protein SAMN02745128_02244 [Legionella maceachernii]SUP04812.1 Uncharacterised protein [Legionella maceachernii]
MKRLEVLHYDKDFSQVKAMPFKLEKENFPLDETAQSDQDSSSINSESSDSESPNGP